MCHHTSAIVLGDVLTWVKSLRHEVVKIPTQSVLVDHGKLSSVKVAEILSKPEVREGIAELSNVLSSVG